VFIHQQLDAAADSVTAGFLRKYKSFVEQHSLKKLAGVSRFTDLRKIFLSNTQKHQPSTRSFSRRLSSLGKLSPSKGKVTQCMRNGQPAKEYIQHGQSLAKKCLDINKRGTVIEPSLCFIELLSNCAW
jgi:hypothetical protein